MSWIENLKRIMNDKEVNIESLKSRIAANGHSLSRNSIGNILNERNSPKVETIKIVADALEVELPELFTDLKWKSNKHQDEVDGFIDYNGKIHRIKSAEDIKELYFSIYGKGLIPTSGKSDAIADSQRSGAEESLLTRARTKKKLVKLQRRNVDRFSVTVGTKRELEFPNNLPRDARIWVFRSKQDEMKARASLKQSLRFSFNV